MDLYETYHIGTTNGTNRVYYRVTVTGLTRLGVAEFRQGWFDAAAVDALFGSVSEEAAKAKTVRNELRSQVDEALVKARKAYLEKVLDPKSTPENLEKHLAKIAQIRLTARDWAHSLKGSVVMEYNPNSDTVIKHSGEKLVMVLSSNPDEIITKLAELSESNETSQTINKFTEIVARKENRKSTEQRAQEAASQAQWFASTRHNLKYDDVISARIQEFIQFLNGPQRSREEVLGRIDGLISLLGTVVER